MKKYILFIPILFLGCLSKYTKQLSKIWDSNNFTNLPYPENIYDYVSLIRHNPVFKKYRKIANEINKNRLKRLKRNKYHYRFIIKYRKYAYNQLKISGQGEKQLKSFFIKNGFLNDRFVNKLWQYYKFILKHRKTCLKENYVKKNKKQLIFIHFKNDFLYLILLVNKLTIGDFPFSGKKEFNNAIIKKAFRFKIIDNKINMQSIEKKNSIFNIIKNTKYKRLRLFTPLIEYKSFSNNFVHGNFKQESVKFLLNRIDRFKIIKKIFKSKAMKKISKILARYLHYPYSFSLKVVDITGKLMPSYYVYVNFFSKNRFLINLVKSHNAISSGYYSSFVTTGSCTFDYYHDHWVYINRNRFKSILKEYTVIEYLILLKVKNKKIFYIEKYQRKKKTFVVDLYENINKTRAYYKALEKPNFNFILD